MRIPVAVGSGWLHTWLQPGSFMTVVVLFGGSLLTAIVLESYSQISQECPRHVAPPPPPPPPPPRSPTACTRPSDFVWSTTRSFPFLRDQRVWGAWTIARCEVEYHDDSPFVLLIGAVRQLPAYCAEWLISNVRRATGSPPLDLRSVKPRHVDEEFYYLLQLASLGQDDEQFFDKKRLKILIDSHSEIAISSDEMETLFSEHQTDPPESSPASPRSPGTVLDDIDSLHSAIVDQDEAVERLTRRLEAMQEHVDRLAPTIAAIHELLQGRLGARDSMPR